MEQEEKSEQKSLYNNVSEMAKPTKKRNAATATGETDVDAPSPKKTILNLITPSKMLPDLTASNSMSRSATFRDTKQRKSSAGGRSKMELIVTERDDEAQTKTAAEDEEVPDHKSKRPRSSTRFPHRSVTFDFNYEPGDYLGIKVLPSCMIVEVDKTPHVSPFWDKLYCGDVLSALNGRPIKSLHDFYKRIEHLQSPISLTVERPLKITKVAHARLRNLKIDPTSTGDRFLTVYILFLPQIKLGLSVKAANNMIILKKVSDEGLATGLLEIGDIILDIDGIRVTSAQDFKDRMVGGLKTRGYVSTVIRRPMSEAMFETIKKIVGEPSAGTDPEVKIDATLIGRSQATRLKVDNFGAPPKKGILVKTSQRQSYQNVKMNVEQNAEMDVSTDVDPHRLSELASLRPNSKPENASKVKKLKNFLVTKFIHNK